MDVQIAPDRICRICLSESSDLKSLCAKTENDTKSILDSLHFVVNIKVSVEYNLPKQICSTCEVDLCSAEQFKRRALNSEMILSEKFNVSNKSEIIKELSISPSKIKLEKLDEISMEQGYPTNTLKRKLKVESFSNDYKEVPILGVQMKIEPTDHDDYYTGLEDTKNTVMFKQDPFDYPQANTIETQEESKRTKKQKNKTSPKKEKKQYKKRSEKMSNSEKEENITANSEKYREILQMLEQKVITENNADSASDANPSEPDTNRYKYNCPTCNKKYMLAFKLRAHIIKVHIRGNRKDLDYECDICKATFPKLWLLNKHVAKTHTDSISQICPLCGKKLSCKYSLQEHMLRHSDVKPVPCDECDKRFVSKAILEVHKRSHSGEKPYTCDECGRSFSQCSGLGRHRRTHTGEKPYKCDVCDKDFTEKASLQAHHRIHTGEKPYPCTHCELKFRRLHHLKTHLKQHDGSRKRGKRHNTTETTPEEVASVAEYHNSTSTEDSFH